MDDKKTDDDGKKRILVVAHNSSVVRTYANEVWSAGYNARGSSSAGEAVEEINRGSYQGVL